MSPGLEAAIKKVKTARALAEMIGVTPQAISQWSDVPPLRVIDIEKATGISRYELRPDLYPREGEAA